MRKKNGLFVKRDERGTITGYRLRWYLETFDLPADLHIPNEDQIREWLFDLAFCETPTGHMVEVDGYGPDGCPSWGLILGIV